MEFLDEEDVVAMHEVILEDDGGEPGILAIGALQSALIRCRYGPFLQRDDLVARAGLLLRGICQDHPFVDGNKRTALDATAAFLERNGHRVAAGHPEFVDFILDVAQGLHLDAITDWIDQNAKPLSVEDAE